MCKDTKWKDNDTPEAKSSQSNIAKEVNYSCELCIPEKSCLKLHLSALVNCFSAPGTPTSQKHDPQFMLENTTVS